MDKNKLLASRRRFLSRTCAIGAAAATRSFFSTRKEVRADEPPKDSVADLIRRIKDPEIRAGVDAAINKNLLPAATEAAYPGHFLFTADGSTYGGNTTWPGLDSWQMAGAYLLLGRTRLVLDYFDYVRASQRKDGNIPFAIFPEMKPNNTCLRGLKWPDDVFTYKPRKGESVPVSGWESRKWIGLFEHWQNVGDPLTTLGPICYILTANEVYDELRRATPHDSGPAEGWMEARLDSTNTAGMYVKRRKSLNGLISGCGFYTEQPPRKTWDGVTQCYAIHAFETLSQHGPIVSERAFWRNLAFEVKEKFSHYFWRDDHFAEYKQTEHGLVDSHGLSDVNWAAVAFGVATDEQLNKLWPRLMEEKGFWLGDMPTQTVTKPFAYADWELNYGPPCPDPPLNDVAAMGRVWYLETLACNRMKAHDRLIESVRKVCKARDAGGYWRERYHPQKDGTVKPDGAPKYCEYPAVLVRIVLGTPEVFCA